MEKPINATERYVISATKSKKEFAFQIVDALSDSCLPHDIFSAKIGRIHEGVYRTFLVYGGGTVNYVCSGGNFGPNSDHPIPVNGSVKGQEELLVPVEKDSVLQNEEGIILNALSFADEFSEIRELSDIEHKRCEEALKIRVFDKNFAYPSARNNGMTLTGEIDLEDVQIVEVPYYRCTLRYREKDVEVIGLALSNAKPILLGLEGLRLEHPEEEDIPKLVAERARPNKVICFLSILPGLMMFFGFYLALNNFKKDMSLFGIWLSVCLVGVALLAAFGFYIIAKRKSAEAYGKSLKEKYKTAKAQQRQAFIDAIVSMPE